MNTRQLVSALLLISLSLAFAPARSEYLPSKVVYDVSTPDPEELNRLLDRAALLQIMYDNDPFEASIVLVIHEGAVPLFARGEHERLMQRTASLAVAEIIEFRLCRASARMQGYDTSDFHEFVTVVPMADAEIVQLQREDYAYLR